MNVWTRRAMVVTLLCGLVAATCAAFVYRALWSRYANAQEILESRSERLDGVISAGTEIESLLESVRSSVGPLVHQGGESAQNEIQQRLRQLIAASGSTLVSSQVALEPGVDGKLARVRITATVSGEWGKLLRFMGSLQTHAPAFWVRAATLMREGANSGASVQNARITLQLEAPVGTSTAEGKQP